MNNSQYAPGIYDTHDDLNGYSEVFLIPMRELHQPESPIPDAKEPEPEEEVNNMNG